MSAVLDRARLQAEPEAWDRLVAAAADPNPHFSRRVIAAHAAHGLGTGTGRFLTVRRGGELVALLPFEPDGARLGWRRAHVAFTSPYVTLGTPLVARHALASATDSLVAALADIGAGLWLLPKLSLDSETGLALLDACRRRGWPFAFVSAFDRAVLDRRSSYDDYARACLSGARRKSLRRQRARLARLGCISFDSYTDEDGLRRAVEAFLVLEAGGWKGTRRTALASRPETAAFAHAWFSGEGGPVTARADVLSLDRRPIAISLALVGGGTATLLKTAYDEAYRSYGPGLLLEDAIVRACHETGFARRLDSAALGGHVLERLYPDRERIADVLIAADAAIPARRLAAWAGAERRRRRMRQVLKGLATRLRPPVRT